jgi:zinc transporter ZupT
MLSFGITFAAILGSFIIPAIVGLLLISLAARYTSARYIAAFAIGIYLWFYSDTIGDASYLGLDEGFGGGAFHLALWVLFAVGLVLMLSLDRDLFTAGPAGESFGFAIPLLVAVAVGMHGFGEGAAIGATAAATTSTNLLDAFGGLSAGVAFVLHKGLEPMMVGAAYWLYARDHAKDAMGRARDILILTAAFVLPGIIGGGTAYYIVQIFPNADFTYIFAFGLGTSVYALLRLARPLFQSTGATRFDSTKIALAALLGFTCLYLAALLHS